MTAKYVTREEFEKFTKYNHAILFLLVGVAFVVPVLYSIAANTKSYISFYGMFGVGFFWIIYSIIKQVQQIKKYKDVKD